MNIRYLKETSEQVKQIRDSMSGSNQSFFTKLKKVINFYKVYCRKKAEEFKAKELSTRQDLAAALLELHNDPYSRRNQLRVAFLREQLANLEKHKSEGIRIRSRMQWKEKGNWCTSEFFKLVREKPKSSAITKLKDE